jgi:hypothetical protein
VFVHPVWRLLDNYGDDSDRLTLRAEVPADDGCVYYVERHLDVAQLLEALETHGERDDRRPAEPIARFLGIRVDHRVRLPLAATCAGKVINFELRLKYLRMLCDLIVLRGLPDADGGRTPDRLGLRLHPHYGGSQDTPTPIAQYSFRSLEELIFETRTQWLARPAAGAFSPPFVLQKWDWLPGPVARVVEPS